MERRESREQRAEVRATVESHVSSKHPEYNEDTAVGDKSRIQREIQKLPPLGTADQERDTAAFRIALELEWAAADSLERKRVYGTLDGVSGDKNGGGMLASRIASGEISDRLADIDQRADAETSRAALEAAIRAANNKVMDHKEGRADLKQMAATVDLARVVEGPNGTHEVAYAHAGDSRIYVYDAESGTLSQETNDDTVGNLLLELKQITKDEHEKLMNATAAEELPEGKLRSFFKKRSAVGNAIGSSRDMMVKTGIIKGLKKGDKVLTLTDGVFSNLKEEQIISIIEKGGGMKEIAAEAARIAASGAEGSNADDVTGTEISFGESEKKQAAQEPERKLSGMAFKALRPADIERRRTEDATKAEQVRRDLEALPDLTDEAVADGETAPDVLDDIDIEVVEEEPPPSKDPKKRGPSWLRRIGGGQ